jgi:hypothetical protein
VVVFPRSSIFRLRQRSLARGVLLALGALAASLRLAALHDNDPLGSASWQVLAVPLVSWGMVETARCLDRKWSLYHAGVLILLYSELMILALVLFLWLYS